MILNTKREGEWSFMRIHLNWDVIQMSSDDAFEGVLGITMTVFLFTLDFSAATRDGTIATTPFRVSDRSKDVLENVCLIVRK